MSSSSLISIVVLGAGGDGLVTAEAVRQGELAGAPIRLAGFLDDGATEATVYDAPVLGRLDTWQRLPDDVLFCPAIQKVTDMQRRALRLDSLAIPRARWGNVIHPKAAVASDAKLGIGVFIASCATVQPECSIGDFASLRAGAMLGHHCSVAEHGYVGPNAVMCGRSRLERGAHLGPGSVLLDSRTMSQFSVAGIGCAVTKNVREREVVFGNPAKRVRILPERVDA